MRHAKKYAQDEMLQRWARDEWYKLGPDRSQRKLFEEFKRKSKEEGREKVPTLHFNDISRWYQDYNWPEWLEQRLAEDAEMDKKKFREQRERALYKLTLLTDDAIETLRELITDKTAPPTVRAKAVDMLLNRVIIQAPSDGHEAQGSHLPRPPAPEASQEEKMLWLQKYQS